MLHNQKQGKQSSYINAGFLSKHCVWTAKNFSLWTNYAFFQSKSNHVSQITSFASKYDGDFALFTIVLSCIHVDCVSKYKLLNLYLFSNQVPMHLFSFVNIQIISSSHYWYFAHYIVLVNNHYYFDNYLLSLLHIYPRQSNNMIFFHCHNSRYKLFSLTLRRAESLSSHLCVGVAKC